MKRVIIKRIRIFWRIERKGRQPHINRRKFWNSKYIYCPLEYSLFFRNLTSLWEKKSVFSSALLRAGHSKLPQQCKGKLPKVQAPSSIRQPAVCPGTGNWETVKRNVALFWDLQQYCGSQLPSSLLCSISGTRKRQLLDQTLWLESLGLLHLMPPSVLLGSLHS